MMSRRSTYVHITPIPSFIPRQLAIDFLHSHGEIIELNPLVTGHVPIKAPRDAPADEFYSTWYEISQRIQYVPGLGKLGSGAITFRGVFHDLPFGLQTHTYAPAGVDLRNKWQICGNQPGEPPEPKELGLATPPEGLYIREDVEIKCNLAMAGFVKKEMKAAAKIMVERLVKKAELLDSGALQGMMENGRLTTVNPADRSQSAHASPRPSPTQQYQLPMSPTATHFTHHQQHHPAKPHIPPHELLGQNNIVMELPGDYHHPPSSPGLLPSSQHAPDPRWSTQSHSSTTSSHPSSYTSPSDGSSGGMRSPALLDPRKSHASELPSMPETSDEHVPLPPPPPPQQQQQQQQPPEIQKYAYNPQDYAKMQYAPAPLLYTPYQPDGNQQQRQQQQ